MAIEFGDELLQIVEIDVPQCTREFGDGFLVSPHVGCQAILGSTGSRKCFNTRYTCQDAENYNAGTLTLRFSRSQEGVVDYGYVIPSIESISLTPMKINIGAMDRSLSPFGQREVVTVTFNDHLHSDLLLDKYRLERLDGTADEDGAYDPYERGTFWGKWLARNPYHEGYALRVYDGKVGQGLGDMQVRHYLIDKINGPNNGKVTVTAKDIFCKIEDRKAKAPVASLGELSANISDVDGTLTLSPSGIGNLDYPASGYIAVGDEAMAFTRVNDVMTLTTRGALNTVATDHDEEDKVQLILVYSAQSPHDIVYDLLTEYAGIDSSNIPTADWDAEAAENLTNLYTAYIADPTPVSQLVGELQEQAGFTVWPDVTDNEIRLKAIVPAVGVISPTVNDDDWIVSDSLSIARLPEQRASQVWIYYGMVNPLKRLEEKTNYRNRTISADLESEESTQYGTPSVKEIFSRWIPQFGRASALSVGDRVLSIFRDPPFRTSFLLPASKDGELRLAEPFLLDTEAVTNDTGSSLDTTQIPVKLVRQENLVYVESQWLNFFTVPGEAPGGGSIRDLYIDSDTTDFDARESHDQLYSNPSDGDLVNIYISEGAVVGSTDTGAAFESGSWPDGVTVRVFNSGRIAGKGGNGGDAFSANGYPGGLALLVTHSIQIFNGGTIAGGGGGGGSKWGGIVLPGSAVAGGGGAGYVVGEAGANVDPDMTPANDGTVTAGGAGGQWPAAPSSRIGGDGGGPAQAGQSASGSGGGLAGSGGAAGAAIQGLSNISWIDSDGAPTMDDGTIVGATS